MSGLFDFQFVTPALAIGSAPVDAGDAALLFAAGITHVIDTRLRFATKNFEGIQGAGTHRSFHYCYSETADDGEKKGAGWFQKGIIFALKALQNPGAKLYVHCLAGVERGPSMAYAVLLALGYPAAEAEGMLRAARPQVNISYRQDAEQAVRELGYA